MKYLRKYSRDNWKFNEHNLRVAQAYFRGVLKGPEPGTGPRSGPCTKRQFQEPPSS